jgi:hypothetical protein
MDITSIGMLPEIKYHYFFSSFRPGIFLSPIYDVRTTAIAGTLTE